MVSLEQRPEFFRFISQQLGENFEHSGTCKCIANMGDGGRIRAVVVYDNTRDCDCSMNVASDGSSRFLTREFLRAAFAVPFVQWRMRRVTALVKWSNAAALRFDRHLGFQVEGVLREFFDGEDAIVLGMLRTECRFIKE